MKHNELPKIGQIYCDSSFSSAGLEMVLAFPVVSATRPPVDNPLVVMYDVTARCIYRTSLRRFLEYYHPLEFFIPMKGRTR